jgi:DNA-directed RNA polymerase subunit omega
MIHPSYVELMRVVNKGADVGMEPVVNSRYSIVSATAKRARQITGGKDPLVRYATGEKALSIAVKELYEGELQILTDDEAEQRREKVEEAEKILKEHIAERDAQNAALGEDGQASEQTEADDDFAEDDDYEEEDSPEDEE